MTATLAVAVLLGLGVAIGASRLLWRFLRTPVAARPAAWRLAMRVCLPMLVALLLHRTLFPPLRAVEGGTLVVSTADAGASDAAAASARAPGEHAVALPEARSGIGAERAPDLATALRRYPATRRLRIVGAGLVARDRDAVRGLPLDFEPAPLPRGLVELQAPSVVRAGREIQVSGRLRALAGGSVELLDPSGVVTDRATPGEAGRFRLSSVARTAGRSLWRLRVRDGGRRVVDVADVGVVIEPGQRLRVLVLAGAPTPELKYLRRWASDAGFTMDTRISLGGGMTLGGAPSALDPDTLARYDVALLDQRAWQALGSARRARLSAAVRNGLGLVLQLSGPVTAADRRQLAGLGFDTVSGPAAEVTVSLPTPAARGAGGQAPDASAPAGVDPRAGPGRSALSLAGLRFAGERAVPLIEDATGTTLAAWQAHGRGRVALSLLDGSYRWVLAGDPRAHAELWNRLLSAAARPVAAVPVRLPARAFASRRLAVCGLGDRASLLAPDGTQARLRVDPAAGSGACAAAWPQAPGWHAVREGANATWFYISAGDATPALQAAELQEATRRLAGGSVEIAASRAGADATPGVPGPWWPWGLGWLLASTALWWFERSRLGAQARRAPDAAA